VLWIPESEMVFLNYGLLETGIMFLTYGFMDPKCNDFVSFFILFVEA